MLSLRRCVVGVVAVLLMSGAALAQMGARAGDPGFPSRTPAELAELRVDANAGSARAQFFLGIAYDTGMGVPHDDVEAVSWYRQAAERGNAAAQFNLGALYYSGQGVPQDYVEAHKWRNLAASRASAETRQQYGDARDEVAERMTSQQLADAQKLAREWLAAFEQRN